MWLCKQGRAPCLTNLGKVAEWDSDSHDKKIVDWKEALHGSVYLIGYRGDEKVEECYICLFYWSFVYSALSLLCVSNSSIYSSHISSRFRISTYILDPICNTSTPTSDDMTFYTIWIAGLSFLQTCQRLSLGRRPLLMPWKKMRGSCGVLAVI